jgi:hypothetical protein
VVRAFLNAGPTPPRLDEDAPTTMAKAAVVAAEVIGTC